VSLTEEIGPMVSTEAVSVPCCHRWIQDVVNDMRIAAI
jgi:hypothetical protein